MASRTPTNDLLNEAIRTFVDNNDIDDDTMDALTRTPLSSRSSVFWLLSKAASMVTEIEKSKDMIDGDLIPKVTTLVDRYQDADRKLEAMIQREARVHALEQKINAVADVITKIADHSEYCHIGHACTDHADMQTLARAMRDFLADA
jgi:hypothetical protein